jgi:hypothetical protein
MIIPTFSGDAIVQPNGMPTSEFKNWIDQLILTLQQNAGAEGLTPSSLTTDNINTIEASDKKQNGTFIYDNENHEMKVNINGTFKTIQVI